MTKTYVPGMGSSGAKLFILGEAPGYEETASGKPFVGPSGKELDRILKDAGINRGDCWVSNVFKYEIPSNVGAKKIPAWVRAKEVEIDVNESLAELQNEINSIKPNCILALGGTALWALSGKTKITNFRGSIMHGMGRKFVATYHPAHLLHQSKNSEVKGYWNRQVMIFDFKRAARQSQFEELRLPQRILQICRNSWELNEYRQRWASRKRMAVDIEALGTCIPGCIGIALDKSHGICVPLWNHGDISHIPDADLVNCWMILAEMLYEKDIVGQNFNYDRDKIKRLGFIIRRLISDTMLKAFAINPELPKSLAFNTSIYTEEPFYKDEGMYEGKIEDLFIGCARDACVTLEIDEAMEPDLVELGQVDFYNNFLMKLPELYLSIENQGFNIDAKRRDELIHKYIEWDERLRYELYQLVGTEVNCNSPKQVAELLFITLNCPQRGGTGEEELSALLNLQSFTDETKRRVVELILENRKVRKTISTYLMAMPDFDGRMRTTYFPCLETGRTSTGQQDPPIRPSIEVRDENGKKKNKVFGTAFQTMTKHGDVGQDLRSMYIPDRDDEVFLQADSAQAEARVVFLLANDEQALVDIDTHDYHALTASWFFGGTEDDYSKKKLGYESPIRFAGKTLRHAGHLGAGKRRAAISVNTDARKYKIPITITEHVAERALKIFHMKQPKIQGVFQHGIVECLKRNRRLIAPVPYGIDSKIGGVRTFYERWGDELNRQAFSYIPQRAVSDNTKAAALRIRARIPDIRIVLESHDSLLFCIKKIDLEWMSYVIKEEMERPIRFDTCSLPRRSLVIPCEIETGNNYQDLHKFKMQFQEKMIEKLPVPKSVTEEFTVVDLAPDSFLDNVIYDQQMRNK